MRDAAEDPGSCRKPEVGKAACLGEGAPGEREGVLIPVLARGRGGRTAGVELWALRGPPSPAEDVTWRSGAAAGPGVRRSQRKVRFCLEHCEAAQLSLTAWCVTWIRQLVGGRIGRLL